MIIAEIAQAHDGSVGILHSYIDALAETGVDAVKFQTHIAEAESSEFEQFRIAFSYVDKTRFDYWKRMELSLEQWIEVKEHCHRVGLKFISSPFSCKAVDLLEAAGVDIYKIGSGEVTNTLMLEKIASTGKPVILSSGMSNLNDLDRAVTLFQKNGTSVSVLQCTTAYPTKPEQWGLHVIPELNKRYNIPVGLSDHSGGTTACIAATALGAQILEFHVVFDRRMFGPDAKASIEIDEVAALVKAVKDVGSSLAIQVRKDEQAETVAELKKLFGKSLSINKELPAGHTICFDDLEAKKPYGCGIAPTEFETLIGKKLLRPKKQWDFIRSEDLIS